MDVDDRLVSYSITVTEPRAAAGLARQLAISWATLRRHDPDVAVVLFVHGDLPDDIARLSRRHGVMVDVGPSYVERLARFVPHGADALAATPTLHKFLNHERLATSGARHVLCCDCDTVFAGPVGRLFDRYGHRATVVAREEVGARRGPHGPDPDLIDEAALADLARRTTGCVLPPFNLGAVLLNDPDWGRLAIAEARFVDLAWRFVAWMAIDRTGRTDRFGGVPAADAVRRSLRHDDVRRALPYPSSNPWILDEVCLWLAYGLVPGLTAADFDPVDVAQNGEFATSDPTDPGWTMCHYFTSTQEIVERWLGAA